MKPPVVTIIALAVGFLVGIGLPLSTTPPAQPAAPAAENHKHRSRNDAPGASAGMLALVDHAATLRRDQWPAFFRARLSSPESARLAAKLWAEADPAGFWTWLRQDFDPLVFDEFAPDLVRVWAASAPDAAMDAVAAITDKRLGDRLRVAVIDTVLDLDVKKGVELAARAGDFNRFGWGTRKYMKKDPAAAVAALASLPAISKYRLHLRDAVPIWAESDPAAALEWMIANPALAGRPGITFEDGWVREGFAAVAKADPHAAFDAALGIGEPAKRNDALAGLVVSGTLDPETLKLVLAEIPPTHTRLLAMDLIRSRPAATLEDIRESAGMLDLLPSERNNLHGTQSLAMNWNRITPVSCLGHI